MDAGYSNVTNMIAEWTSSSTELSSVGGGSGGSGNDSPGRPWDSSDPFFSAQARNALKTVFKCYIRIVIVCLGIPGNFLCCLVFWKQGLKDRINLLLFWLAVADFFNLLLQLPVHITCYLSDAIVVGNIHMIANANMSSIYLWFSFVSGTLIVVMSVDRCLSVVMPLKARWLLTYRPMVAAITLSYLIPFVCYLPWFMGETIKWRTDPGTQRSIAYIVPTSWFPAREILLLIPNYLGIIGQPLYFMVVVVCNTITVIHLRHSSHKRSEMMKTMTKEDNSSDNRITVMMLVVCVLYAVLLVSQICALFIQVFVPDFFLFRKYHNSYIVMYQVFIFTASVTNSTVNVFAYLALSSKFRATVKELCFCLRPT